MEQKGLIATKEAEAGQSWGEQFIKSASYEGMMKGAKHAQLEVKNTVTNAIANTQANIRPGVVPGAFLPLTIESILSSAPTNAPSITYVKENVFTNSAAEVAEGAAKAQSSVTFSQVTLPVETVAHWIKITKQLAADNAAVAAYINVRMRYGLDLRVDGQLVNGNGTTPNLAGLMKAGNYTAHGYSAASLAAAVATAPNRADLIRLVMAARFAAGYPCTGIILNPADWATIELLKDSQGNYLFGGPARAAAPTLWGLPVYQSISMTADQFLVGNFAMAATKYDREGVQIGLFEQDENNVQLNLLTLRAERRLCLAVDTPAALSGGDLTPA